jgi:hypothetical protein
MWSVEALRWRWIRRRRWTFLDDGFSDSEFLDGRWCGDDEEFQCGGFGDDELLSAADSATTNSTAEDSATANNNAEDSATANYSRLRIRRRRITRGFGDGDLVGLLGENIGETLLLRHNVQILQTGGSMLKNATVDKTSVSDPWHLRWRRILGSVHWITDRYLNLDPDPDLALSSEVFKNQPKISFFKQLIWLFTYCTCTVGTFTSVFKDSKSQKDTKQLELS